MNLQFRGNRLKRGDTLTVLKDYYPRRLSETEIISYLEGLGYEIVGNTIKDLIEYLVEKQLIEKVEIENRIWVTINTKGIDLVEGNIETVPGIEFCKRGAE